MKHRQSPKSNMLRVRLSDHELSKLESFADKHNWTVSHVIREYIRRLPSTKEG